MKSRYSVKRKFAPKEPVQGLYECRECSSVFSGTHTYNKPVYCSERCRLARTTRLRKATQARYRAKHYTPPQPRDCEYCDLLFTPGGTRSDARFCSLKCGNRARAIERIYKIKIHDYHKLFIRQRRRCAGCGFPFGRSTPYVDHDHETGRVRGLLHGNCNSILGFVTDNPDILRSLAKYLEKE